MKRILLPLLLFFFNLYVYSQSKYTLSGYIRDKLGEELIGANVIVTEINKGVISNTFGFYSITLPKGKYTVSYAYIGYKSQLLPVDLSENKNINISLEESTEVLNEVEVSAERPDVNVKKAEMSTVKLDMKTIQRIPVVFGETDILKTILLLPGVISSSEASGGFHVRGGNVDQNLILLDNASVYNASHAVGFFSVFNGDAIKDMKLYKGGIPAEYGGRISSILDIVMKEGNKSEYHGTGGIGLISSRLTLEGPVVKNKVSFLLSGRRTYYDLFFPLSSDSLARKSKLYFYDLNAKINYTPNDNNRFFLSGYFGRDVVKLGDLIDMDYGNFTITARWNHVINRRIFLDATSLYSNYVYNLGAKQDISNFSWMTYMHDFNEQLDFTYYMNPENTVKFGLQAIRHNFSPGKISGNITETDHFEKTIHNTYSWETGIYLSDEQEIGSHISVNYGLRYSLFYSYNGGKNYIYNKSNPQEYLPTDTLPFKSKVYYNGFEPRLSIRYSLDDVSSIKASYNRMFQYIQLASNSTAALPLDFWFPSSLNMKPQIGDQVALGYFRNFKNNMIETSVEVYYKNIKNSIDFRDRAQLLLNDQYEAEIRVGNAWSYGVELSVKKQVGKLSGWISYTYSRTYKKIPEINEGKTYQASYDKPHNLALVSSYDFSDRFNVSANWIYTSAPPRTFPTGRFEQGGEIGPVYSDRNSVRIFPYHRLDLSATLRLNRKKKRYNHLLNISVYNAYAHKNPIMVTFRQDENNPNVTKAYIVYLYKMVPSITYNFNF